MNVSLKKKENAKKQEQEGSDFERGWIMKNSLKKMFWLATQLTYLKLGMTIPTYFAKVHSAIHNAIYAFNVENRCRNT